MLLLDNLLLAPGTAVMKIFEELARKAQEEFLDDGPVKKELQEIYALLESGGLSETDFASREELLLQRLEQIARLKLPAAAGVADVRPPVAEVFPPAPDFTGFDVPRVELPTLELPPIELPGVEFPPVAARLVELPHVEFPPAAVAPVVMATPAVTPPPPVGAAPPPIAAPLPTEPPPARLTPPQVVECALRGLVMLKMKVSAVTAVTRVANGWHVIAELIESRAVPDTSDLLGVYEVELDEGGNVLGYVRTRMRRRCDLGDRR